MRRQNFAEIDSKIQAWNADLTHTHQLAHNQFSDMTAKEKS
jgi:hypothetical protein